MSGQDVCKQKQEAFMQEAFMQEAQEQRETWLEVDSWRFAGAEVRSWLQTNQPMDPCSCWSCIR